MNLQQRVELMEKLGVYILSNDQEWQQAKRQASLENNWFIPEFVDLQSKNIGKHYLDGEVLRRWVDENQVADFLSAEKIVGIVMAGNIPLVGFHDFLSAFISGHKIVIKRSSKDLVLITHLVSKLISWAPELEERIRFSELLKGCDAYIATGSNNSARYFDYYFRNYPHIIRRNRTSVAVLDGNETVEQLDALADDVYQYFGLGCRNVTKLYVPRDYDFYPLLEAFKKYLHLADHSKYKNNYDYQLAVLIINKMYYMTNGSIILLENKSPFSPISVLHYEYFDTPDAVIGELQGNENIQCIVSKTAVPFGKAQQPAIADYADNRDTLKFLLELKF
jgi:hypothetical protein